MRRTTILLVLLLSGCVSASNKLSCQHFCIDNGAAYSSVQWHWDGVSCQCILPPEVLLAYPRSPAEEEGT